MPDASEASKPKTLAEIAAEKQAAADAETQKKLAEGDEAAPTPENPRVTVDGDAKHGWHITVHDGSVMTTHSPEAADEAEAREMALDAHREAVEPPEDEDAGAGMTEEEIKALVETTVKDQVGKIDLSPAARAALDALLPQLESHIEQKVSASLLTLEQRVRKLENPAA